MNFWDYILEGSRMARDAHIGAIGAEPIRQLYWEGKTDEANQRAKELLKANTAGIALASGAASSSLLADLLTTAGTTVIDTIGDGDSKNLAKNVAKNAIGDLLGFGAGKALNHFIDLDIIKKAFKDGRLRIGEPTTYTAYHQSDNPITQFTFPYKKRWDVVTHGADPNAAFFTVDNPAASGFLSKRPYTSKFDVTVQRPLIQTGEINGATKNSMRNKIVKRARKLGADGVLFDGIADNQLQNQRILMAFDNSDIKHLSTDYGYPFQHPIRPIDVRISSGMYPVQVSVGDHLGHSMATIKDEYLIPMSMTKLDPTAHRVSIDLYDGLIAAAKRLGLKGVRSGDHLISPARTRSITNRYINAQRGHHLDNMGFDELFGDGQPRIVLTEPLFDSSRIKINNE